VQVSSPKRSSGPRPATLARQLAGLFRYAALHSDGAFMREVSEHELTLSQLKTLSLLSDLPPASPLSLKEVAARLGISLPAASRAVDPLVRRGLVERREDAGDRRIKRVRTTAAGDALTARLVAARVAALEELLSGFSVTERRKLGDALDEIVARPEIERYCPRKGGRDR
jgi:DNA-binding MarR family transcriptional regulator